MPQSDVQRVEGSRTNSKGIDTYTLTLLPKSSPRAVVFFHHGFSDHCGRHAEVLAALPEAGYALYMYDIPGHGRSGPREAHLRNYVPSITGLVEELVAYVEQVVRPAHPGLKVFLAGHSMGGLVSALAVARHPALFSGVCLSSPVIDLQPRHTLSDTIKGWALWAVNWTPGMSTFPLIDRRPVEAGIRDKTAAQAMKEDPLWDRGPIKVGTAHSLLQGCHMLAEEAPSLLGMPLFAQQGAGDIACNTKVLRAFLDRLRGLGHDDITYLEIEEGFHDLFHDPETPRCMEALLQWLRSHE